METKLYPGIAFSPQAVLTDSIGAADTIIPVSDVSAFPDAPNLATIGVDEEGETVFYTAKTDTVLSGCVRGVEGTAKAWLKGELIARNWTAKDHGDLIAAVGEAVTAAKTAAEAVAAHAGDSAAHEDIRAAARDALKYHQEAGDAHKELFAAKQNKLTGTPGQVVGFDAKGEAQAVPGWSNTNLLINSDFRRPVNRNGKTEYAKSIGIDLWHTDTGMIVKDGYISVKSTLYQFVSADKAGFYLGKQMTLSLLTQAGKLISGTKTIPNQIDPSKNLWTHFIESDGIVLGTYVMKNGTIQIFRSSGECDIVAVKTELGPTQTLAHQDADGSWVLNDPLDYDLQYALCSQYSPITGEWVGSQHSNPNLLDNWYFGDPVNQRGQTEYMNGYTIDRWKIGNGTVSLVDGHIAVQHSSETLCVMQQLNQELYKGVSGKIVTISLLLSDGLLSATGIVPDGDDNQEHRVTGATGFGCEICLYKSGPRKDIAWQILLREQNSVSLIAAKLELGPVQTLAHQDADGSWVLNDPPPNKALELAKCQKYFLAQTYCNYPFTHTMQNDIEITIPTPVAMRVNPATAGFEIRNANSVVQTGFSFSAYAGPNCVKIIVNKTNHGITSGYLAGLLSACLDANL